MRRVFNPVLTAIVLLSGCQMQTLPAYTAPEESGLIGVRAYPTSGDICQVIGENALTNQHLGDASLLIGCPSHEVGAIEDRMAEGAVRVDQVGSWVLLSQPAR